MVLFASKRALDTITESFASPGMVGVYRLFTELLGADGAPNSDQVLDNSDTPNPHRFDEFRARFPAFTETQVREQLLNTAPLSFRAAGVGLELLALSTHSPGFQRGNLPWPTKWSFLTSLVQKHRLLLELVQRRFYLHQTEIDSEGPISDERIMNSSVFQQKVQAGFKSLPDKLQIFMLSWGEWSSVPLEQEAEQVWISSNSHSF